VERNLFGEFSLVRTWGRIGQPSQIKIELHTTEQDAQAAMLRRVRQKQRRGYA
jgi:predicted DNA-binding WGR domain protein